MSFIFHRVLDSNLATVVSSDGNYLVDSTGKRYLDACGGAAVSCLGHDNQYVRQAICDQVNKVAFAHTGVFTNEPAEELAEFLVSRAPKGTGAGRVIYLGSGSEAMEAALKLARQYHLEQGNITKDKFISRQSSYHGNTIGALAIGGHEARKKPYAPLLMDVAYLDPCYAYRYQKNTESEVGFGLRMANLLEAEILKQGAENIAGFIAEPVVGATLGSQPAAKGYFKRIREICDQYDVLFIADEVMCGMGRTGSLFALEQEDVYADLTTLAKGLGAGYQPIAALLVSEKVVNCIAQNSGKLWNGHTYMSHAVATAGSLAVQKVIERDDLIKNVNRQGLALEQQLISHFGEHPNIGNIRGRGLFWTIEIVKGRQSKVAFCSTLSLSEKINQTALDAGLIIYPAPGCIDGINGDHVLFAPSYTSTFEEIADMVLILKGVLKKVLPNN